jgi:prevent-host-death family protein
MEVQRSSWSKPCGSPWRASLFDAGSRPVALTGEMWLRLIADLSPQEGAAVSVGVRDLRNNLSRHLAAVRDGETVVVTDHGNPIARIVPWDRPSSWDELVAAGVIIPARFPKGPAPTRDERIGGGGRGLSTTGDPRPSRPIASDLIDDQRR